MVPISLRSAPLDCFERNPAVLSCFGDLKRNSNRMEVSESLKLRRKVEVSAQFKGNKRKPKTDWRRRRDSNPRDPFESNGFQDRRLQPLGHSSGLIIQQFTKPDRVRHARMSSRWSSLFFVTPAASCAQPGARRPYIPRWNSRCAKLYLAKVGALVDREPVLS